MKMIRMQKVTAFLAILVVTAAAVAESTLASPPSKREIDRAVEQTMETFKVPGMAVSVVYDGKLYYSAGHGLVEVGQDARVDDQTLFRIASVSKAFTAAALAILADDGKLTFEDRVIDHIPEFRMYDPWVTREFTVRDLLTHRSGLPLGAGDLLLFPQGNATSADIIHAFRYLKPSSSFRSHFDYDNLLYIVAGEVIERASGLPFDEFVEQRLLARVGMDDCVVMAEHSHAGAVVATPHLLIDGEYQVTHPGITSVGAPAGGIACSARSMARWMTFILNEGVNDEVEQVISPGQFAELLKPVTVVGSPGYMVENAGSHLSAYALGWNVSTFYGLPSLSHSGGLWGMTTFMMLLPDQGLGIFASNNLMSPAPRAIVAEIADEFLAGTRGTENKDWIAIISDIYAARQQAGDEAVSEAESTRAMDSTPSLPLEKYTGTYRDPWYGDIHISLDDYGQLWFSSDRNEPLQGPLEHFQYDTFVARWTDRRLMADAYVSFTLSPEGKVEKIRMKAVSPNTDFSYDFHDLDLRPVEVGD